VKLQKGRFAFNDDDNAYLQDFRNAIGVQSSLLPPSLQSASDMDNSVLP
jgi:hypothetical protein